MESEHDLMARRMRLTFDLCALGEAMMRQRLRRRHPHATEAEIDGLFGQWLQRRPGAEQGDAVGRPVAWPRGR